MNALTPFVAHSDRTLLRKNGTVGILERLCVVIEPTDTQKDNAKDKYEAVGNWLADAPQYLFSAARISPQGSFALGTATKPLNGLEYDVDLLCRFTAFAGGLGPVDLKRVLGDRLRENGTYRFILQEMPRCWRLNFAGEFHMDITPSVPNAVCRNGGELVPDKKLRAWKPTNPSGYLKLFEKRAALTPIMRLRKALAAMDSRGTVDPFPEHIGFKGILRRIVQLLKRHRDIYFETADESLRPISVILTTLAARAYEFCVGKYVFDSEFDVMLAVVSSMPYYIESYTQYGKPQWYVANETTEGENFAEKWNLHPERAAAFFEWHRQILADVEHLATLEGSDQVTKSLAQAFGSQPVNQVVAAMAEEINMARQHRMLSVAPKIGIVTGASAVPRATPVRSNTFYGRK
ncbi:nucleotidyltransferase domain-containing protein [Acidocella facilis]|uniref:nucleotidyltransferase domain-containing protein n=1 Tax=Acidocella facilis TaxID=525 RepID=UPI001F434754|nr:nucleotidyltransferase [Acidocella facilis]